VISLQSFAVLVHEAICPASDECLYINTSTEESDNEYESFREILVDLRYLDPQVHADQPSSICCFTLTNAGYELLAAHNLHFPKENNE